MIHIARSKKRAVMGKKKRSGGLKRGEASREKVARQGKGCQNHRKLGGGKGMSFERKPRAAKMEGLIPRQLGV